MQTRILLCTLIAVCAFVTSLPTLADAASRSRIPIRDEQIDGPVYTNQTQEAEEEAKPKFERKKRFGDDYYWSENFYLEGRLFLWMTSLTANMAINSGGIEGTTIDFIEDLGLDPDYMAIGLQATLKLSERNRFSYDYISFAHSGEGVVNAKFTFNGVKYEQGVDVATDVAVSISTFTYELDLVRDPMGYLSFRIAVDMLEIKPSIVAEGILKNEAIISATVPKIGAAARINVSEWVAVTGGFSMIGYENSSYLEYSIFVDINPAPMIGAFVGYKTIGLNIDVDDGKGEIEWSGITLGAALRF